MAQALILQTTKWLGKLLVIMYMQTLTLRWAGPFTLLVSVVMPTAIVILLRFVNPGMLEEAILGVLAGNVVASSIQIALTTTPQVIANMRDNKAFAFFATLPIPKTSFLGGIVLSYVIQSLPGVIIVYLVSGLILGQLVIPTLWTIFAYILLTLSLVSIGGFVAMITPNALAAGAIGGLIGMISTFILPVYFPIDVLPRILQYFAKITPIYYGIDVIKGSLVGNFSIAPWISIGALVIFMIVGLIFFGLLFRWRE